MTSLSMLRVPVVRLTAVVGGRVVYELACE